MSEKVLYLSVPRGTISAGDIMSIRRDDDEFLVIDEVAATPGFTVIFAFEGIRVIGQYSNQIQFTLKGYYDGVLNHDVKVYIWNFNTETWDGMTSNSKDLPDATAEDTYTFTIDIGDYVDVDRFQAFTGYDRSVQIMIQHDDAGNAAHKLHIDQVLLDFITTGTDRHRELLAHA